MTAPERNLLGVVPVALLTAILLLLMWLTWFAVSARSEARISAGNASSIAGQIREECDRQGDIAAELGGLCRQVAVIETEPAETIPGLPGPRGEPGASIVGPMGFRGLPAPAALRASRAATEPTVRTVSPERRALKGNRAPPVQMAILGVRENRAHLELMVRTVSRASRRSRGRSPTPKVSSTAVSGRTDSIRTSRGTSASRLRSPEACCSHSVRSNSPLRTPARNTSHSPRVNRSAAPSSSFESWTRTCSPSRTAPTQPASGRSQNEETVSVSGSSIGLHPFSSTCADRAVTTPRTRTTRLRRDAGPPSPTRCEAGLA